MQNYKVAYQAGKDEDDRTCYHVFVFEIGRDPIWKDTFYDHKDKDGKIVTSAKDLAVDCHDRIMADPERFLMQ